MKSQSNKKGGHKGMVNDKYILGYKQNDEKKEREAQDIINELVMQKAEATKQEILKLNELKDYLFKKDAEMNKLVKEIEDLKEENKRKDTSMKVQKKIIDAKANAAKTFKKQKRRDDFVKYLHTEINSSRCVNGKLNILQVQQDLKLSESTIRQMTDEIASGVVPCVHADVISFAKKKHRWVKRNVEQQTQ